MQRETPITKEHVKNNRDIRKLLAKSGIKPEKLPPEEDIRKLENKVKKDDNKLLCATKKLKNNKEN